MLLKKASSFKLPAAFSRPIALSPLRPNGLKDWRTEHCDCDFLQLLRVACCRALVIANEVKQSAEVPFLFSQRRMIWAAMHEEIAALLRRSQWRFIHRSIVNSYLLKDCELSCPRGFMHSFYRPIVVSWNRYSASCNAYLPSCESYLRSCNRYLTSCESYLGSCNRYLVSCESYLDLCNAYLASCRSYLRSCNRYLMSCGSYLWSCNAYFTFFKQGHTKPHP